jgi:hypothetical protein
MLPARLNQPLTMTKGGTFRQSFLLQQPVTRFRPVTTSKPSSPVELTVPNHGLLSGQPIWIEDVRLFVELNKPRSGNPIYADVIDSDTLRLVDVSGAGKPRAQGGQIIYQRPVDLTGASARIELVLPPPAVPPEIPEPAPSFDAEIDPEIGKITVLIPAGETAAMTWTRAKFRLWVTMSNGDVEPWIAGEIIMREAW